MKNTLRVPDRLPPPQRQLIEAFVTPLQVAGHLGGARCAEFLLNRDQCTAHERGAGVWLNFEMPLTQNRRWAVWSGGSNGWLDH